MVEPSESEESNPTDRPDNDHREEPFHGYSRMVSVVGRRHAECSLGNFHVGSDRWTEDRSECLKSVRQYISDLPKNIAIGRNLILTGSCGTGKDHLAAALIREALSQSIGVVFVRGCDLMKEMRQEAIANEPLPSKYLSRDLLVISDIEPRADEVSQFGQWALYDLLDARYRCAG